MNKRNLDNETLDLIGRKLIGRGGLVSGDIDKIVTNPKLFQLVTRRIAADEKPPAGVLLRFLRRNAVALACVTLVLIAAITAGRLLRSKETVLFSAKDSRVPDAVPEVVRPVIPPQGTVLQKPAGRPSVIRFSRRQTPRGPVTSRPRQRLESDFYAVAYTGDPAETADGGRIIRVNLDRSSLFALGVNLALENDTETFQADLLVGSDGVTRGLRVVK